ncbi:MAG: hypothetical protein HQ457_05555 [Betaproteobacteria bacterium]|nr:hypothetical protein [Betaproteobacteria bacterium]
MANTCWNLFSFYGNEKVVAQVKKWQEALDSAKPTEDDKYCMGAIRTVFYPDAESGEEIYYGSKWVHQDKEALGPDENQLGFQSAWSSPNDLQEHLTLLMHKLDRSVLVENSYNIEDGSMGFVYTAIDSDGNICIEIAHADLNLDDFDDREDADADQQERLNEWQEDTVIDLITKVPNIELNVKTYMPYLEIDWDRFKE